MDPSKIFFTLLKTMIKSVSEQIIRYKVPSMFKTKRFLNLSLGIALYSFFLFQAHSTTIDILKQEIPKVLHDELKDLSYTLDPYGNISIDIRDEAQIQKLRAVKHIAAETFQNKGVYVRLPLAKASLSDQIEGAGYELYQLDRHRKEITFLYRNGRAIPFVDTAFVTASIFIVRIDEEGNKQLLVINEYDKKDLTVPAGHVEGGELAINAVLRETKEEVGLDLNPADVRLYSVRNRTFKDTGRNHVDFNFFTIVPFDSVIKIDGKEVLSYIWVPLSEDALKSTNAFEKNFSSLYSDVINSTSEVGFIHMLNEAHCVVKLKKGLPLA
jgi:8-oxo-dGTP pyrophosphatase MutT (NUDIX family)